MAKQSKKPAVPGDIRVSDKNWFGDQPLNADQRILVQRAYELFRFFYDKHRDEHMEMSEARKIRQLRHEERAKTAPPSTALLSSIDNVIADQIDNMPEALLVPEREETAQSAEEMTDIVGFVMYQAGWPGKYQRLMEDAAVVGTGRSDFPNQINNVLAFPGIFRGALDVRASDINEEMKLAAAHAIADLVSDDKLCPEYILPEAFDERVGHAVAKAVGKAARDCGIARI